MGMVQAVLFCNYLEKKVPGHFSMNRLFFSFIIPNFFYPSERIFSKQIVSVNFKSFSTFFARISKSSFVMR